MQQKWEEKEAIVIRMEKENRLFHVQLTKQTRNYFVEKGRKRKTEK